MKHFFKTEIWQSLLDTLSPECCLCCGVVLKKRLKICYCPDCLQEVRLVQEPICTRCGKPFARAAGESHLCGYCLNKDWHFRQARAAVVYQPPVSEAIKLFKYNAAMNGLATFTALARQYLQKLPLADADVIVPVPLHVRRLRQRSFNQSLVLCRKIFSDHIDKVDPHVLERQTWIRPQTGLSGAARRRNVRNAFRVCRPERIRGKRILLVDDVFTTGATVNECARLLRQGKADRVDVFTLARTID